MASHHYYPRRRKIGIKVQVSRGGKCLHHAVFLGEGGTNSKNTNGGARKKRSNSGIVVRGEILYFGNNKCLALNPKQRINGFIFSGSWLGSRARVRMTNDKALGEKGINNI
jgi:hypothetical protein